jgi:gas vesicle protein
MTERKPQSPDEIMADIERTRSEIDSTLAALEQRISPRELVNALGEALVPARDGTTLFARNLGVAVRENPVPAALVGLGLGWLAVSGTRGAGDGRGVGYQPSAAFAPTRANPSRPHHDDFIIGEAPLDSHPVSEGRAPSLGEKARDAGERLSVRSSEAKERLRETADDVAYTARKRSDDLYRHSSDVSGRLSARAQNAASASRDFARAHPLGIALAVAGLGALAAATAIARSEPRRRYIAEQAGRVRSEIADRGADVADAARDAASRARDAARDMGERARDAARDMGERARDSARDMGDRARDTARDVSERATDMGERARERATDVGGRAKESAGSAADRVRAAADDARAKAENATQRMRSGDAGDSTTETERAATAAHGSGYQGAAGIDHPAPGGPGPSVKGVSGVDRTASTGSAPVHRAVTAPQGPLPDGPLNQGARANVKKDVAPSPESEAD